MRALVTGATGFIGEKLLGAIKDEVHVLSKNKHKKYPTIICDLARDEVPIDSLRGIDVIFHLAGIAHDVDVDIDCELYQRINVDATVRLFKVAAQSSVKKFIYISSVKAGGRSNSGVFLDEYTQNSFDGVYGKTKREAELSLLDVAKTSNMHVSIVRPSLVYGPNPKGNLKSMLLGIKNGWFPPLPETGNCRSMIHVDDLVRAILLVAKDKRANREIYIATDGLPYSSRDIYNTMCNMVGRPIPKWSVPKILFDLASLMSSNIKYKINKLLGDECYSSNKLEALGFQATKSLKDMNETDF